MLIYIVFLMIFVGVTAALYQVYEIHYNINVGNDKKLSTADKSRLEVLSGQAKIAVQTHERAGFDQAAVNALGAEFDRDIVLKAFAEKEKSAYAIPLLRRKNRLLFNGNKGDVNSIKVHHLPFWKTKLPSKSIRIVLIISIIVNCFLIQLLGGLSIYTIGYPILTPFWAWLNEPFMVMLVIYALVFMAYVISRLDMYMHDLYQLRRLFSHKAHCESRLQNQYT
ncbi:hypothetical protein [Halomonas sp. SpR8]|uniref:hypothetical protein n=1 Tax=Halomonas sp. SpR8 TaxID=3050463 RepID=UPI0027E43027|nr:hypothetical protein [Halomonas sp. SpR8]MDQ7729654.1 hypothetical protein [Halomonas sp. SpR8]